MLALKLLDNILLEASNSPVGVSELEGCWRLHRKSKPPPGDDSSFEEVELPMDMSRSCHCFCKSLPFRIILFVVKAEIEQFNSLGFNYNGFLFGQSVVMCAFHVTFWFSALFSYLSVVHDDLRSVVFKGWRNFSFLDERSCRIIKDCI